MTTRIYVFKTSVRTESEVSVLKPFLDRIRYVTRWNFDLKNPDDKILRVEATENISKTIADLFDKKGFRCLGPLHHGPVPAGSLERSHPIPRFSFILLLAGGLAFWIGALTPPYRQWITNNLEEYLTIIYHHRYFWYFMHAFFFTGVLATALGLRIMAGWLAETSHSIWFRIAADAYSFGTLFVILNFAFRLTVTTNVADVFVVQHATDPSFQSWLQCSNLIFAVYMLMGYFSAACMGYGLLKSKIIPRWTAMFCIYFGVAALVTYPAGFILFAPPLMIHVPYILTSIAALRVRVSS
jgi:hypothetical protein